MAQVERCDDVTVIHLDAAYEALDQAKFEAAQQLLLGHAQTAEPPLVVLDLSQTAYMGSAFIEVMFRAWKRVADRDGKLVLCGVQPLCKEVLHTTRLDSMVQSFANVDDAVQGLRTG
ncbi:MAG TPA: STAS domain-containing protein [Pirellulales bacterium]|nr:STAS domain-containing protein [Pirellulales bacterium]